jgi:hypothetical protein
VPGVAAIMVQKPLVADAEKQMQKLTMEARFKARMDRFLRDVGRALLACGQCSAFLSVADRLAQARALAAEHWEVCCGLVPEVKPLGVEAAPRVLGIVLQHFHSPFGMNGQFPAVAV